MGGSAQRINGSNIDKVNNLTITIDNESQNKVLVNKHHIIKKSIAWYRRFGDSSLEEKKKDWDLRYDYIETIINTVNRDRKVLKNFIFEELEISKWLTNPSLASLNKLKILTLAKSVGFRIPATLIGSNKKELLAFIKKYPNVIIKAISEVPNLSCFEEWHTYLTHKIKEEELNTFPTEFPPTCFQEMIDKEYELRVFFLDNKCYSMAIISQKDKTTRVDFRNYNTEKPNRNVPYKLPKEIEYKIQLLMNEVGLNTGSIDLIKDINGEYVFLEINPVGQFGMVSQPCNYYLEKKVAEYLINNE